MRILFYHTVRKDGLILSGIHIAEVFNHFTRMGHNVIYADGEHYKTTEPLRATFYSQVSQQKSRWVMAREYFKSQPFRGEVLVSLYFLNEIRLFFLACRTMFHYKPELIYRRHGIFCSDYILSKIFKIPAIQEVNGIAIDEAIIVKRSDRLSLRIIDSMEKCTLTKADKYIVVTSKLKDVLHGDYKIPKDKIIVIENGANTDLFKPMDAVRAKTQLSLQHSVSYICFIGGFSRWQGIDNFVKAMPSVLKECVNARALVVGDGEMKYELLELAIQLGISDKVIFTGKVPYDQVMLYINASEICVAPFVRERNQRIGLSPLKLCEYMACGKPVVASRISGLEILEENKAGLLVNPEDYAELAQAIIKLLREPSLRQQMGENGRKYVLENRSWQSVAEKVAGVCKTAIEEYKKHKG